MWSSCGFNMALFREYLSAVVSSLVDRNWLSFCRRSSADSQAYSASSACSPLHESLPSSPPSCNASLLCPSTGWELGKFLRSVKRPLIRTGKPRFFVSSETLDTGKWASPSSHLWCWGRGRGETERFAAAFSPPDRTEIWSLREKLGGANAVRERERDLSALYKTGFIFGISKTPITRKH